MVGLDNDLGHERPLFIVIVLLVECKQSGCVSTSTLAHDSCTCSLTNGDDSVGLCV